jgi:poly-gamma-glutamate synthesis protein (capsule biosynthesis protein)
MTGRSLSIVAAVLLSFCAMHARGGCEVLAGVASAASGARPPECVVPEFWSEPPYFLRTLKPPLAWIPSGVRTEPVATPDQGPLRITISAAGDCTLGALACSGYEGSFHEAARKYGDEYFFRNVKDIFENDDVTIVNLETTLTHAEIKAVKKFNFRGLPEYSRILQKGGIEAVNIANNHTHDYRAEGYQETLAALQEAQIGWFGNGRPYLADIKGVRVGCLGYEGWDDSSYTKTRVQKGINRLRQDGADLVIVSFHWGDENQYSPNSTQRNLGRYAVDCGADLVLGHHPHVIQGIELYRNRNIVYSLGNFAYGGNRNPADKDTFIFQQTFEWRDGRILDSNRTCIVPCSVSSVEGRNNYQPTPLDGERAEHVAARIRAFSKDLSGDIEVAMPRSGY